MSRSLVAVLAAIVIATPLAAQEQHILRAIHNELAYVYETDTMTNPLSGPSVVHSHLVSIAGAASLRVVFSQITLGPNDYIELTSVYDGHSFRLTPDECAKWEDTSPYFNGSNLEVRLVLAPGSTGSYSIDRVLTGATGAAIDSICGSTDDRVNDTDFRAMRFVSSATSTGGGCTIWPVSADDCVLTAGHCLTGSLAVAETMVPQSLSSGQVQHPSPRFQWTVNRTGSQFVNGGTGNDWGFLRLNLNNQGETASSLVGHYDLGFYIPTVGTPIRITGYGSASGTRNSTLKTHAGALANATTGTTLRYTADTTGGNSGSPVIDDSTGLAIGIHTHAGCNATGGSNQGTSITRSDFRTGFEQFCPAMQLTATGLSAGLRVELSEIPQGTIKMLTLWSGNTSSPAGQGVLFGLNADTLTLSLLAQPSAPGNLFHTDAPFNAGLWPSSAFEFPAGSLVGLNGVTVDGVAVAVGAGFTVVANSLVERVTIL